VANTRVSDLAKQYGVPSKEVISLLGDLGEFVKAPSSGINPLVEKRFNDTYGADLAAQAEAKAAKKAAKKAPAKKAAPAAETGEDAAPAEVAAEQTVEALPVVAAVGPVARVVVVPVVAAAPRVRSVVPVARRAVGASPSGPVVKSSSRWRPRRSVACASARATARPFAWPAVRR